MSAIATIRANLEVELAALKTAGTIADWKFGRRWDFAGYPSVRYYLDGIENEQIAGGGGVGGVFRRTWRFRLEIIQTVAAKGEGQAEIELCNAVDGVMNKFEDNYNLNSGNDLIIAPFASSVQDIQGENGRVLIAAATISPRTVLSYS